MIYNQFGTIFSFVIFFFQCINDIIFPHLYKLDLAALIKGIVRVVVPLRIRWPKIVAIKKGINRGHDLYFHHWLTFERKVCAEQYNILPFFSTALSDQIIFILDYWIPNILCASNKVGFCCVNVDFPITCVWSNRNVNRSWTL